MNLKKKVIFGMVAGLFAVATVFNMSTLNNNGVGDVSLEDIAVMAQAQSESENESDCLYCGGDGTWGSGSCPYCSSVNDGEEPIDENYDAYGNYPLYEDVCRPCVNYNGQQGVKFSCEFGWGWCEIDYQSFNCTYGFC